VSDRQEAGVFTHCRQFPHLAGLSDDEIRQRVRDSLAQRPRLIALRRMRNVAVILLMALVQFAAYRGEGTLGLSLMIAGAAGTGFVLVSNLIWINSVLFRITKAP
jgi:hypothetical protein